MSDRPFFSIILPTYNRLPLLKEAVESVWKQTFGDFELIVVDDGSTDGTMEWLESNKEERLFAVSQPNMERSAARNNGISKAKGYYVCFLDSDDFFFPDTLKFFHEAILKTDDPGHTFFFGNLQVTSPEGKREVCSTYNGQQRFEYLFEQAIMPGRVCIPRERMPEQAFNPKVRIGEDRELWMRVLQECKLKHIDQLVYNIRVHGGRTVHPAKIENLFENSETNELIFSLAPKGNFSAIFVSKVRSYDWMKIAQLLLKRNEFKKARKAAGKALRICPGSRTKEKLVLYITAILKRTYE